MTNSTNLLQQTISGMLNSKPSEPQNSLSERQKGDAEAFLRIFPSEHEVLAYFAPAKWAAAIANADKATSFPEMTLKMLDTTYSKGLAERLVDNNIRGLYSLGRPHEPIINNVVQQSAQLFVAKYGADLSVFGTLLYFAQYLTDYKSTYGQFDLIDVLKQCGKAFLPAWLKRLGRMERGKHKMEKCVETGRAALYSYLRREYLDKGRDLSESNLVQFGVVSEEEIRFIKSGEVLPL